VKALAFFAFAVLLVLKLADVIGWSWRWVTSPLWGYLLFAFTGWAMRSSSDFPEDDR
jgi:hypothetical protein